MTTETDREAAIAKVIASATRLGVELDEREAAEWVAAMENEATGGDLVMDVDTGVYGHRISMLDFKPQDLARFREMAKVVGFDDRPPQVLTALAISGSAAQSKVNAYPADCDFFERIHIKADTRTRRAPSSPTSSARRRSRRRRSDASTVGGEVRYAPVVGDEGRQADRHLGADVVDHGGDPGRADGGHARRRGAPRVHVADGIASRAGASSTGSSPTRPAASWRTRATCWTRRGRRRTARSCRSTASSTRTTRRSTSSPSPIPLFSKLVKELSADSVDDYVEQLEHEVWKYTVKEPNYGKAARRMYNVFRMNGKYREAAYIRELFDEPVTALYQVSALVRTLDDAANSGDTFDTDMMVSQVDGLIMSAIQALDGPEESEMVAHLLKLRNSLQARESHEERSEEMSGIQDAALEAVNTYFERALRSVPEIEAYLEDIVVRAP